MFYSDLRLGMHQGDLHKADDEDGSWITMNGTHVHMKDGEVDKGPQSVKDHVAGKNQEKAPYDIHDVASMMAFINRGGDKPASSEQKTQEKFSPKTENERRRLSNAVEDEKSSILEARERAFQRDTGNIPSLSSPALVSAQRALENFNRANPAPRMSAEAEWNL